MTDRLSIRAIRAASIGVVLLLGLAACGEDTAADPVDEPTAASAETEMVGPDSSEGMAPTDTPAASGASLAGICPDPLIIQTDWNPEAEHGALYEMVGEGYTVDADAKSVTGPLVASGEATGIDIEVRVGGPAIGFQQVVAQMYQDDSIFMGYALTDEQAQNSIDLPVTAVVAPLEINPQIIMWDPETHPDFDTIADIGQTDTTVRYFGGATYMEYFLAEGILQESQADGSYDGAPASFVASGGANAQQGFASAEPYIYENEVAEWMKPIDFELIHDTGYEVYAAALALKPEKIEENRECLQEFVPIVQQAQVDYITDAAATNELIVELVEQYNTGWVYSPEVAEFSVQQQLELGLVGNGPDDTLGNFDEARVEGVLDILGPVFEARGTTVADDLSFDTLYTNEFIDPSIGL